MLKNTIISVYLYFKIKGNLCLSKQIIPTTNSKDYAQNIVCVLKETVYGLLSDCSRKASYIIKKTGSIGTCF